MGVKAKPIRHTNKVILVVIAGIIFFITILIAIFGKPVEEKSILTAEQKEEFSKITEKLQTGKIKNITRNVEKDKGGKQAYILEVSDGNKLLMYSIGNKIVSVMLGDNYLYADGEYKAKYTDYVVTLSDATDYQYVSKQLIKEFLKSPKSADFPGLSDWSIYKKNNNTIVKSYVDAENSFGASLRSEFQIIFSKDKEVISLKIDGKEYVK